MSDNPSGSPNEPSTGPSTGPQMSLSFEPGMQSDNPPPEVAEPRQPESAPPPQESRPSRATESPKESSFQGSAVGDASGIDSSGLTAFNTANSNSGGSSSGGALWTPPSNRSGGSSGANRAPSFGAVNMPDRPSPAAPRENNNAPNNNAPPPAQANNNAPADTPAGTTTPLNLDFSAFAPPRQDNANAAPPAGNPFSSGPGSDNAVAADVSAGDVASGAQSVLPVVFSVLAVTVMVGLVIGLFVHRTRRQRQRLQTARSLEIDRGYSKSPVVQNKRANSGLFGSKYTWSSAFLNFGGSSSDAQNSEKVFGFDEEHGMPMRPVDMYVASTPFTNAEEQEGAIGMSIDYTGRSSRFESILADPSNPTISISLSNEFMQRIEPEDERSVKSKALENWLCDQSSDTKHLSLSSRSQSLIEEAKVEEDEAFAPNPNGFDVPRVSVFSENGTFIVQEV